MWLWAVPFLLQYLGQNNYLDTQVSNLHQFPCATQTLDVIKMHGLVTDSAAALRSSVNRRGAPQVTS